MTFVGWWQRLTQETRFLTPQGQETGFLRKLFAFSRDLVKQPGF